MISGNTRRKILIPQNVHIVRVYVTAAIFESNFNRTTLIVVMFILV